MAKTIALIGALDTKGEEFAFVQAALLRRGHNTLVINTGVVGEPALPPNITASEVAAAGGVGEDDAWGDGGGGVGGDGEGVEDRGQDVWFEGEVPWVGGGGAGDVGEDFVGGPDRREVGDLGADVDGPAFF